MIRWVFLAWALVLLVPAPLMDVSHAAPPRDISHALGEVTLDGVPARVVTLYQAATDTAVALGIEPVGVVESWAERPVYRYLREDLQGVDLVGLETQPNLEEIAWLAPDLIVGVRHRHEQVYPLLSRIAPTVVQGGGFEFRDTLALMGQATGRQEVAARLLEDWEARVADFQSRVRQALDEEWPQEVAVINFRSDHARIYYSGFAGSILNELGFRRPEAHRRDAWGVKLTNEESIPAMNADVIFVFMNEEDPAVMANYHRWTAHPLWQTLDAVTNAKVYRVDQVTWNLGGGILAANALLDNIQEHYGLMDGASPTGEAR